MAQAVFTNWTDLHSALLNAYADFVANRIQYLEYTYDSGSSRRNFKFQDPDKLWKAIQEVKLLADLESGSAVNRTYARNGGRA